MNRTICSILLGLLLAGCSKEDELQEPELPTGVASAESTEVPPDPHAAVTGQSADEALRDLVAGLKRNEPEAIWEHLPESYQSDINNTLHAFAEQLDPDLWSHLFATLKTAADVAQEKRGFLVDSELFAPQNEDPHLQKAAAARTEARVDATIRLLGILSESSVSDLEQLQQADAGVLLEDLGGQIMSLLQELSSQLPNNPYQQRFQESLNVVDVQLKMQSPDRAVVLQTVPANRPGETITVEREFVRIEGQWVPEEMAESWDQTVADARQSLLGTAAMVQQNKPMIEGILTAVDNALQELREAEDQEQFDKLLQQRLQPLQSLIRSRQAVEPPVTATAADEQSVTVIVEGGQSNEEAAEIEDQLFRLTDDAASALTLPVPTRGGMQFVVSPVKDIKSFAQRIDFAEVTEVDVEDRQVRIRLK